MLMKKTFLKTLFQRVEMLQQQKLYWYTRMIWMACVPQTFLLKDIATGIII